MTKLYNTNSNRDFSIDLLRFIGLSLIILAHVSTPAFLHEFRSFDVPLMVFVSGLAYSEKSIHNIFNFYTSRTKRLLIPVYSFLIIYFLLLSLIQLAGINLNVTLKKATDTFLLLEGIGFVWIIRVFLLVMLITPFVLHIEKITKSKNLQIAYCISIIFLQNIFIENRIFLNNFLIGEYFYYITGYGAIFMIGIFSKNWSNKRIIYILSVLLILIVFSGLKNASFLPNSSKYPPHGIFLYYGIFCSLLIYFILRQSFSLAKKQKNFHIIKFTSNHSIWIYLYHIPLIQITGKIIPDFWLSRYMIVYFLSCLFMIIQLRLVERIQPKLKSLFLVSFLNYLKN